MDISWHSSRRVVRFMNSWAETEDGGRHVVMCRVFQVSGDLLWDRRVEVRVGLCECFNNLGVHRLFSQLHRRVSRGSPHHRVR